MQIDPNPRFQAGSLSRTRPATTGGTKGNSRLTAITASVLLVLLAAEGLTLLSLHSLLSWHIFIGMLLIPIVALKLASTGYRFARYYTGHREYVQAGPPPIALRLLGPVVVATTIGLFGSGLALAVLGPGHGLVLGLHKASFVVWFAAMTAHVLAHALRIPRQVAADVRGSDVEGSRVRFGVVSAGIAAGAILAVATLPLIAPWTQWMVGRH